MKKNGFTLIEILIVVVILGILFTIAVTSSIGFSKRTNEKFYAEKIEYVLVAARQLGQASMDNFVEGTCEHLDEPVADAKCFKATVQDLVNKKYLKSEDIIDPRDKSATLADIPIEIQFYYGKVYAVIYDDSTIGTGTVSINGGAATTNTRDVTLALNYNIMDTTDAQMCVSNESTCLTWQPYQQLISWELTKEAGVKTVSVWFKDQYGKQSNVASDTITFSPSASAGTFAINNGDAFTGNKNVTLNVSMNVADTGVTSMCVSNGGTCTVWQPYDTDASWVLSDNDGLKTVRIWFRDEEGDQFADIMDTIYLDLIPPTNGSIQINSGATYSSNRNVTLSLSATDASSGLDEMCISNTASCTTWENYSTTKAWTLPDSDGNKTVSVWFRDAVGNVSIVYSDDIILDRVAPINTTISINNDDSYTRTTSAILALSSSDATSGMGFMCISQTPVCSLWVPYVTSQNITLTDLDGTRTVYVIFRDLAGNSSTQINDTIVLDREAPVSNTITINNDDEYASTANVVLTLSSTDLVSGLDRMCISETPTCADWIPYATSHNLTLSGLDGIKNVYVIYIDKAGNSTSQISDQIILDRAAPVATTIVINGGANYTNSINVDLFLEGSDGTTGINEMCISQTTSCSTWIPYATSYNMNLTATDGTRTVYVRFRDFANNVSNQINDTIVLDRVAPTASNIIINGGAIFTNSANASLTLSSTDATSGTGFMCISQSSSCSIWVNYSPNYPISLTGIDGTKTVYAIFRDRAGNQTSQVNDTIILDRTAPTGSMVINSNNTYSTSTNVTLTLSNSDAISGVDEMCISNITTCSTWESYSASKAWVMTSINGTNTVYVWFRDRAGNVSIRYSDTIILDTNAPTGSITINSGSLYATTVNATLTLASSDAVSGVNQMCISESTTCSIWEAYSPTRAFALSSANGLKTVYVWFRDNAGNVSIRYSDTITLDTVLPTGSITINSGATYATSTNVLLSLPTVDATAGVNEMCISQTTSCTSWITYASSYNITLTSINGVKPVYAWFRDRAGNVSIRYSDTIILDTEAPIGTVSINGGSSYTNSLNATLTLTATDATSGVVEMCVSQTPTCTSWVSYATTYNITLTATDGTRTVYVIYRDAAGRESAQVSDTITLDRIAPATGTIAINGGDATTINPAISLALSSSDLTSGLISMCISQTTTCSTWVPYATSFSTLLVGADGTKPVYVVYQDRAGNISARISDTIILDTTAPTGTVTINSGAGYTNSTSVNLSILSSDETTGVTFMCISQTTACSTWIPYATSYNITLTAVDGTRTVYAMFRDTVGHESIQVSDTIVLDRVSPTNGTIIINGGSNYTNSTSASIALSSSDATSGLAQMCISQTPTCTVWEAYSITRTISLTATDGTRTVYVKYRDHAGNESVQISASIVLDRVNPSNGTIIINSGAPYTNNINVSLALTSSDALSGIYQMCISNTASCSAWEAYATSKSWALTIGDATKTVYVQYRDRAGNTSAQISDTIIFDGTPPTSNSISINSGATYAVATGASLTLTSSDPTGGIMMCVSQTTACSVWVSMVSPYNITLNSTNGTRTVYVIFRDLAGNQTAQISDTIILDTVNPSCTNSGDSITWTNANRTIYWGCSDATSGCNPAYSGGNTPFTVTTQTAVIPSYVIRDNAGREVTCAARTANVYVDKTLPVCGVWTPNPSPWKPSGPQTFNLSGSSDLHSGISVGSGLCTTDSIANDTCSLTIRDVANNTRLCDSPPNRIDGSVSTTPVLTVSEAWTSAASVAGSIGGSTDPESGILRYEYSMSGATTLGWTTGTSFSVTNAGQTTVSARAINGAGLPSATISKTVKIDRTIPTPAPTLTVSEAWTNAASVAGSISGSADAESGINRYEYSMSGATTRAWTSGSVFSVTNEGQTTVTVRAVNGSGLYSATTSKIVKIDRASPNISEAYFGAMIYDDANFSSGLNSVGVYNNAPATGTVTLTRFATSTPVGSYAIRINSSGTPAPGLGGFVQSTLSRANTTFIHKMIARIPVGYTIQRASNATGDSPQVYWITSQAGTGTWEEYIYILRTGPTGSFSTFGHVYLTGTAPVSWDLAYATIIDSGRMGTSADITFVSSDPAAGVNGYGINQSNVTPPTFTSVTSSSSFGTTLSGYTANGTYYVWTRDAAGNVTNRAVIINNVDTTPPTGTNISYTNGYITSTSHNVTFSASDTESGISSFTLYRKSAILSGGSCGTYGGWTNLGNQTSPYSSSVASGNCYQYYVVATNTVGLSSSTTTSPTSATRVDTVAPTGNSITIDSGAGYTNSTSVSLSLASSDSVSGMGTMCISNTTSCSTWEAYATSKSWTLTSGDAAKTVYAWFRDNAGVQSVMVSDVITLDTTPPSGSISINSGATYTTTTSVTLGISGSGSPSQMCVSNTTSCSAWEAYATSKSWTLTSGDGTKTVYIWFRDAAGNTSPISYTDTIILDVTDPTCSAYVSSGTLGNNGWYTTNVTISATSSDATSGVASITGASTLTYDTASYTKTFTVTDNAGNTNTCSRTVKRDATPPVCGFSIVGTLGLNGWYTSNITISPQSSDAMSGYVSAYRLFTVTSDTSGTNTAFTEMDNAGNSIVCTSPTVKRDATAPSCTNSGDSTSWTSGSRTIYRGCSDGQSGCSTATASTTYSSTTRTATIAAYTIYDNAGNATSCPSRTANVYVDRTAPTCTNSGDSSVWTIGSRVIYWGCSDAHSGCNTSYDGGSTTFTNSIRDTTIAAYTIQDWAGNSTSCPSRTASVYIDKTAPNCSWTHGSWGTTTTATVSGWDNFGSGVCQISNGTGYISGSSTTRTFSSTGTHTGYVQDCVGNSSTCTITISSRTEYQSSNCLTCDRCSAAGCYSYSSWATQSTSRVTGCTASTSTYYRYTCTLISTNYSTCYYGYGISSPCYTRAYQTRYCATFNQSCALCGCASWNAYSAWTTTVCYPSSSMRCNTRTTYY